MTVDFDTETEQLRHGARTRQYAAGACPDAEVAEYIKKRINYNLFKMSSESFTGSFLFHKKAIAITAIAFDSVNSFWYRSIKASIFPKIRFD